MPQLLSDEQQRRHAVFQLTGADIELLRGLAGFTQQRLPSLLEALHPAFVPWPEIHTALVKPAVHGVRVSHWRRVVSGRLDDGYAESAMALASALYSEGVPAYALTICHATVANGISKELGLFDNRADGMARLARGGQQVQKARLRSALISATWLDLEVLLETYATANARPRAAP